MAGIKPMFRDKMGPYDLESFHSDVWRLELLIWCMLPMKGSPRGPGGRLVFDVVLKIFGRKKLMRDRRRRGIRRNRRKFIVDMLFLSNIFRYI